MALRFQQYVSPETYLKYRDASERAPFEQRVLQPLTAGVQAWAQGRQMENENARQQKLEQILSDKNMHERMKYEREARKPIPLTRIVPGTGMPLVDAFQKFRAEGLPKEQAQANPELLDYLNEDERKYYYKQFENINSPSSGYFIPRGVDPTNNKPVYSSSKKMGLFYDDGTPYTGSGVGTLNLKTLPSEQIEKEGQMSSLEFALDKVANSYADDFVGPVSSRTGRGKQYLEGLSTPEAADFYGNVSDLRNQLVYLRSGKQINEQEYKRLLESLPNENLSPTDFKRKFNNFLELYNQMKGTRKQMLQGTGYRYPDIESKKINPIPGGRIRVTNGSETLEIDESDLADAQKEGYRIVR